jgi:hypothetical protein
VKFSPIAVFAGSKSVVQDAQEGMPHLAVSCLEEVLVGRSFILDLLHAETLARLGYEGHRGCQA